MHQGVMGLLLATLVVPAAADEAYRWQDARGAWHFSGREGAPAQAEGFRLAEPVVVDMPVPDAGSRLAPAGDKPARKGRKKSRKQPLDMDDPARRLEDVPVTDRDKHRLLCEKWHDSMLRKRHFDHDEQDAYDRECILKVHW